MIGPAVPRQRRPRIRYGVAVVIAVWVREGGTCQLCGLPVVPQETNLDYGLARCDGGPATVEHLWVLH